MSKGLKKMLYPVKKLAKIAGVSVRALHHYDRIGLLKPAVRTKAGYRLYGEKEMLRLQQILFYKELEFSLREIHEILDDPDFNLVRALKSHKRSLHAKQDQIDRLLVTIDKTIQQLKKGEIMLRPEDLYEGLSKDTAEAYRQEAAEKYSQEAVEKSEEELMKLGADGFKQLKAEFDESFKRLFSLMSENPESDAVQAEIATHYRIIRQFWGTTNAAGKQAEAYAGLGQLYVSDDRYTQIDGNPQPRFAEFLSKAMAYFAKTQLS